MSIIFNFSKVSKPSVPAVRGRYYANEIKAPSSILDLTEQKPKITYLFDKNRPRIDRSTVGHFVTIGGLNLNSFIESIDIDEKIGTDDEITIMLDNTEFRLSNLKVLSEGHVIVVRLFDGQSWYQFNEFLVVDAERSYQDGGKIRVYGRSRQIKLQFTEKAQKWENILDSDIVLDIAKQNGLLTNIKPTSKLRKEVSKSSEATATFLNKLALRNGYEWKIEGNTLYFRPPEGTLTNIELHYRPTDNFAGEIISASRSKKNDSKRGEKATAKVPATDFEQGTIDSDTVSESMNSDEGRSFNIPATGTTGAKKTDDLKKKLDDKVPISYKFNGKWDPIYPDKIEVRHPEVAGNADEAKDLASGLNSTNAYDNALSIETYGQNDIQIRLIINVFGLATADNGKWLVTGIRRSYSASNTYRLSLDCKSNLKPTGTGNGSDLPSNGELNNDTVKPAVEEEPDSGYIFNVDTGKWDRQRAK